MPKRPPVTYRDSGVDIDAATRATSRIRELARETVTPGVLSEIGGFGGLFDAGFRDLADPILVSSTDGVGTKLKAAFLTGKHDTVGGDLVNHCVNDIGVQGARPLFFMDYIATGKLDPDVVVSLVAGVTAACRSAGCALLGGETAEMPGFYSDGEYDIAGFIVGVVDRARLITGAEIRRGDLLVGLPCVQRTWASG
jgi:phosphoribosylformylglycinamidine cyclo-ligase